MKTHSPSTIMPLYEFTPQLENIVVGSSFNYAEMFTSQTLLEEGEEGPTARRLHTTGYKTASLERQIPPGREAFMDAARKLREFYPHRSARLVVASQTTPVEQGSYATIALGPMHGRSKGIATIGNDFFPFAYPLKVMSVTQSYNDFSLTYGALQKSFLSGETHFKLVHDPHTGTNYYGIGIFIKPVRYTTLMSKTLINIMHNKAVNYFIHCFDEPNSEGRTQR